MSASMFQPLLLWGLALFSPLSLAAAPSPAEVLAQNLVESFNTEDNPTPPADAFDDLFGEAFGEGVRVWTMQLGEVAPGPGRAVASLVLLSATTGRPVDLIFAYAQERQGTWEWTGLNEDKAFRSAFLRGLIDGDFDPDELTSFSELTRLGSLLNPALELLSGTEFDYDSRWHQASQTGALLITGEPDDSGEAEQAVVYFRKTSVGWVLLGSGYDLSVEGFFPDLQP